MSRRLLARWALACCLASCAAPARAGDAGDFFEARIRPILATQCAKCHGADKQSSGLRVDSRAALVAGGDRGPAIVPGDPKQSLLIAAVRHHDDLKMPPDEPLPEQAVADLAEWIRTGAAWADQPAGDSAFAAARHWAFQPLAPVEPPDDPSGRALGPIDQFILAELQVRGLRPGAPASKHALLRRAYFDLIGLPPEPGDIADFLVDDSRLAFAKVVDRLLASPRYGERWGRHWMDVVRYADTAGDNADYPVPELHLYRDYIVAAFNNDKPFDQFVREQVAGDILAAASPGDRYAEQVLATGFIALSRRYGTMPRELWHLTLEDTIDTLGQAFLGLSLRCARCHDHKFDPITSEDYYALYGIFDSTRYAYAGSEEFQSKGFNRTGFMPLVPPAAAAPALAAHAQRVDELRAAVEHAEKHGPVAKEIAALDRRLAEIERGLVPAVSDPAATTAARDDLARLQKEKQQATRKLDTELKKLRADLRDAQRGGLPPDLPGAYAVSEAEPHDACVQRGGEPADAGPVVRRDAPKALRGEHDLAIPQGASGRRELAEWLASEDNPLTARVIVNRVWRWHFGKGIVDSPSNFGTRGAAPTHPQLLDWLSQQFLRDGWSIKSLHRQIMLSRAYQLSSDEPVPTDAPAVSVESDSGPSAREIDPDNRLYWRFDRRRLDAESLRDSLLAVAGTLDLQPPAAHPFPPLNEWHWTQHSPFKTLFPSHNRSVYLMTQRLQRHPFLSLFDGPDTNSSSGVRTAATVPSQALYFLNNPLLADQVEQFATRLLAVSADDAERWQQGTLMAWGRPASPAETERALAHLAAVRHERAQAGDAAEKQEFTSWVSCARVLLSANEFVYVD